MGPNKGSKYDGPSPTQEPDCPGATPDSTAPSCATSDKASDLSVPRLPHLQEEGDHVLTLEGSRENESA